MRICGEAIGVSIENSKGGWDNLIAFANESDNLGKSGSLKKSIKRKGSRELHNLSCSINYDKRHHDSSPSFQLVSRVGDTQNCYK